MRVKCPTETYEAARLVDYLRHKNIAFTHVANETSSRRQAIKNKQMGLSPGFPDYVILLPGKILFLELKRKRGGRISPEQKEWLKRLNEVCPTASVATVANGFEEAKKQIEELLK